MRSLVIVAYQLVKCLKEEVPDPVRDEADNRKDCLLVVEASSTPFPPSDTR